MSEPRLEPGTTIAGRYRVERFLAEGGFGAVYIAEHTATEARVALKVLWRQTLASADAVEKFKLEAKVAGRVKSDHIVRVLDAGLDEATQMPFLVMELLDGSDLGAVVESGGPLAPALVVQYLRQVCSALDRAHGYRDKDGAPAPIVHRDLKPENLFLGRREDGSPQVKVLDFGIAKVISAQTKVTREVKGTPLFMAFEQASGGPVSPQTDIWAIGLIAFYLLTGKNYWRAPEMPEGSMTQLFGEVLSLPIVPPSVRLAEHGADVRFPDAFDAWFLRCVDRDPGRRFATAGEAAESLAHALGVPVTAMPTRDSSPEVFHATIAAAPASSRVGQASERTIHFPGGTPVFAGSSSLIGLGTSQGALAPAPRRPGALAAAIGGGVAVLAIAVAGFVATRPSTLSRSSAAESGPPASTLAAASVTPVALPLGEAPAPRPDPADVPATAPAASASPAPSAPASGRAATSSPSPALSAPSAAPTTPTPGPRLPPVSPSPPRPTGQPNELYGDR